MNALSEKYIKLLCKVAGYYTNDTLYRFSYNADGISLIAQSDTEKAPSVLISGREYYKEQVKSYPIDNKKELINLLKLEFSNPRAKFKINKSDSEQTQVGIWQFSGSLPNAKLIIPESFLFHKSLLNNQVLTQKMHGKSLFVASLQQGVISSINTPLLSNSELFCLSAGIVSSDLIQSSETDVAFKLMQGLSKCKLADYLCFFTNVSSQEKGSLFKSLLIPPIAVLTLYLALSSVWLVIQQSKLENNIASQKTEINKALSTQNDFDTKLEQLAQLHDFIESQQAKSEIWFILAEIFDDTKINAVRYSNGRFAILGETPKATDLLAKLIALPKVQDAKFDFPVRKSKKHDNFHVSFIINSNSLEQEGL